MTMVSITPRKRPHGTVWRVQKRVDGKMQERTFPTLADAENYASQPPFQTSDKTLSPADIPVELSDRRAARMRRHVVEEAEFMLSCGRGLEYTANAMGMTKESVERACYRAGRTDLIHSDRSVARSA